MAVARTYEVTMQLHEPVVDQVRDVLKHLYDFEYLESHPLVDILRAGNAWPARERLLFLRRVVLEALERLNPGGGMSHRAAAVRAYYVLNLHYVEGMTIDEVARELGLSERQAYRALRAAENDLAAILLASCGPQPVESTGPAVAKNELVRIEAERLPGESLDFPLDRLVGDAVAAVEPLAQRNRVQMTHQHQGREAIVTANQQLLRHAVVSQLSHAIQHSLPGTGLEVVTQATPEGGRVEISYSPMSCTAEAAEAISDAARQLLEGVPGQLWAQQKAGRAHVVIALKAGARLSIVVIDDNEGMAGLFGRYLTDQSLQIVSAADAEEGLRLARELKPALVVLDVILPEEDGWEVLRKLQSDPDTRAIPVVVCSVLDDPKLAYALGATYFLAKPVTRPQLMTALAQCCFPRASP